MVVSYLDLANDARGRQRSEPISVLNITNQSGDSLQLIQAVNQTFNHIRRSSVDIENTEVSTSITTTVNDNILTSPTGDNAWNPQIINRIKLQETGNELVDIPQVARERAKELEFGLEGTAGNPGKPLFFYVEQGVVKIIPTPDQVYTLQIFYQTILNRITSSNITGTVLLPEDYHEVIADGIFAQLRRGQGDPEWVTHWDNFKRELSKAYIRNKYGLKKRGKRLFRMRRSVDRTL